MTKRMPKVVLILLCVIVNTVQLNAQPLSYESGVRSEIDAYVHEVMDEFGLPGVALAIIKDEEVLHKNFYGYASVEHRAPISEASIFRVYSLTKPVVAVGLFQLIEQGKLSLDDHVSKYVPALPDSWKGRQIKHLLTHSSGLPDVPSFPEIQNLSESETKSLVFSDALTSELGAIYEYNQTNFWLLQEVIEQITNESLADFIISNQFGVAPDTVFFSSDSRDIIPHRVTAYFPFTKGYTTIDHPYTQGDYTHAMNGLNITLDEFIRWNNKLLANELIRIGTRQEMWRPFPYAQSSKLFTYGWDKHVVNSRESFGFSGSLVTAYRIFPAENYSIIFLANGMGSFFDIEEIMNRLADITYK